MNRKEALEFIAQSVKSDVDMAKVADALKALEQEPQTFKWCTDCREYDQEKHCCHRWSKVIRDTVEEMKQERRWIPVSEKKPNKGGEYLLWGKIDESEEEDYYFIGDYYEFEEVFGTEISNYDLKTLGFIDTEIEEYYSVIAWMPLPKPYNAESEE